MKVALVDLNFFEITGESPYLIHMQQGLKQLGIESEILIPSASGRRQYCKWKDVLRMKDTNLISYLKNRGYDRIHFNNGRVKEKDYELLDGLSELKVPKTLQVHGVSQAKTYNMETLLEKVKPSAIFNVDPVGVNQYKKYNKNTHWVELPFCQEIMPLGKRVPTTKRIVVPARFTFAKYPGEVLEVFKGLSKLGFTIDYYGYSGFVANAQGCREEFEYLQGTGKVRLNPDFHHPDKFNVYNGAMFAMDGTRIKDMGKDRIQYATLEAMFYGIIPVTHPIWHHKYMKGLPFDLELLKLYVDNKEARNQIKVANYSHLEHYRAEKVCNVFKIIWEGIQ